MKLQWRQIELLKSTFKQFAFSVDYFRLKRNQLIKFYKRLLGRRRYIIAYNVLRIRAHRLVIVHNVLRPKGGLVHRSKKRAHVFFGVPIEAKKRRPRKTRQAQRILYLKQTFKRSLRNKKPKIIDVYDEIVIQDDDDDDNERDKDIQTAKEDLVSNENSTQNGNAEMQIETDEAHANENKNTSEGHISINDSLDDGTDDENCSNIFRMPLEKVAAELVDEIVDGSEEHGDANVTNGVTNGSDKHSASNEATAVNGNGESHVDEAASEDKQESVILSPFKILSNEDISEKLRQQLKLLKMGKTNSSLLAARENTTCRAISARRNTISTSSLQQRPILLDVTKSRNISRTNKTVSQSATEDSSQTSSEALATPEKEKIKTRLSSGLIDSLFKRLKSFEEPKKVSVAETTEVLEPATRLRARKMSIAAPLSVKESQRQMNRSTPSASNLDFIEFDLSNKSIDTSALLPTPRVEKSNKDSVFVSEKLDAFLKENALENVGNVEIKIAPKIAFDEALMTDDAEPPSLSIPERPVDMQRPRTLAEKRLILQRQKDVLYQMIEHESSVYHELKKRVKFGSAYSNAALKSIQEVDIPFTRDCWRATSWINTKTNRFFYRTIHCDQELIKLPGDRGNNENKLLCEINDDVKFNPKSKWLCSRTMCCPINGIKIANYDEHIRAIDARNASYEPDVKQEAIARKLDALRRSRYDYSKPGPLCKKVKKRTSLDIEFGQLEILTLPTVQLEVWPEVGRPLPDTIKPLMKTILPEGNIITPEWANFAVSVVQQTKPVTSQPQKQRRKYKKPSPERKCSFVFDIPYVNNQTKILVRRRRRPSDRKEPIDSLYGLEKDLEFCKSIDRSDKVTADCADALASMIHSVAVTLNENNFIANDPDIDYVGKIVPIECQNGSKASEQMVKDKTKEKNDAAKTKVMKELKRLNVTIINAIDEKSSTDDQIERCKKDVCRFGCICESIESTENIRTRCSRVDCMFECKCAHGNQSNIKVPLHLVDRDLDRLHARATARLAKEEKDFTSTIVVSNNDVFMVPNGMLSSKRSTKKPKRYNELDTFTNFDDLDTMEMLPSRPKRSRTETQSPPAIEQIAYDKNVIDSLRHVNVLVKRLPELNVETWCMVHCLYRCFCKGQDIKGQPFSFKRGDNNAGSTHWEAAPARRPTYTFARSATPDTPTTPTATAAVSATMSAAVTNAPKTVPPITIKLPTATYLSITMRLPSARVRPIRMKDIQRRTIEEIQLLRQKCDELERPKTVYLEQKIAQCKSFFTRENRAKEEKRGQEKPSPNETSSTPEQTAEAPKVPLNSVEQLNQLITNKMRNICAAQRRFLMDLKDETFKLSVVRWDRILKAFNSKEIIVWLAQLSDNSATLLLTLHDERPVSQSIVNVVKINEYPLKKLPLLARMIREGMRNDETVQLAVMLLRLPRFWRILGTMHSSKRYVEKGMHVNPRPEDNVSLTRKIEMLHQLMIGKARIETAASSPAQSTPIAEVTPPPIAAKLQAKPTVAPIPSNMDEQQLQMLLPIPLAQNQRWLMMSLGDDFTHIWMSPWQKFISLKRIRAALQHAKQANKTIELSPPNCHPSVFVTAVRQNEIFVGPYQVDEAQKLALFYQMDDQKMYLSENYAKMPGAKKFTRKTIGNWMYAKKPENIATSRHSGLKITSVRSNVPISFDSSDDSPEKNEPSTSTGNKPLPMLVPIQMPSENGLPAKESTVKLFTQKVSIPSETILTETFTRPTIAFTAAASSVAPKMPVITAVRSFNKEVSMLKAKLRRERSKSTSVQTIEISDSESDDEHTVSAKKTRLDVVPIEVSNDNAQSTTETSNRSKSENFGFIICPPNISLGRIPAEIEGDAITVKLTTVNKDVELSYDQSDGFSGMKQVNNYMTKHIWNTAYAIHPKELKLPWVFCNQSDPMIESRSDHSTISLNSNSVVFETFTVDLQSNYSVNRNVPRSKLFILDVYKLASQTLPRHFAKASSLKDIVTKAKQIEEKVENENRQLNNLKTRYQELISEKMKSLRSLQNQFDNQSNT